MTASSPGGAAPAGTPAVAAGPTVTVTISDKGVMPTEIKIPARKMVQIVVKNETKAAHGFNVEGIAKIDSIEPGAQGELKKSFGPGKFTIDATGLPGRGHLIAE